MNVVIGTVKTLNGQFFAKDSHGDIIELHVGDKITKDMIVYGADTNSANANIKIGMLNLEEAITLTGMEKQTFDMSLVEDNNIDDLISPNSLEEALKVNVDLDDTENTNEEDILDDTEAGEEQAVKGQSQADVFATRDGDQVDVSSTLRNAEFNSPEIEVTSDSDIFPEFINVVEPIVPPVIPAPYNATVNMTDISVNEGMGTATLNATIDNAPTDSDLVLLLDNGATITFIIGATAATSTTFTIQDDDVYIDGDITTVHTSVQSGGNEFDNLDISDTANITVADTTDTTTVNITANASVSEGGTITYTATIAGTDAPQNDVTVALSNGETITIASGTFSNSVTVDAPADTVYEDGTTLDVSATVTATDGNYENLVVGTGSTTTPVETIITDTPDTVTVNLTTTDVNEDDATVTFTANLTARAGTEDVIVVTDQGTITIAAGTSSGSITVSTQDSDVYLDADSITAIITSATGGDFENLVAGTKATAQIADTTDTTTLDLSATSLVNEGGDIIYTATVDNAPEGDLTVELSNGQTITILDGQFSGSVTFTTVIDIDTDDEIINVYVTGTNGGNYESLIVGDGSSVVNPVTTTVNDGTDILVILSVADNTEGVDPVIYTATLSQGSIGETVVHTTLGDIIIADGETTGTLEVVNPNSEDIYLDASSFDNAITSVEGDDSLLPNTDTVTVLITDTTTDVTVSLGATNTITEAGADVVYTATLSAASQGDTVVNLDNGETITITDGNTQGTVTVTVAADEDVYVDAGSMQAAITTATGGNFENIVENTTPAVTTITDTINISKVTLSSTDVSEDDVGVTFTATLDHPTDTEMTITTTQGDIVIAAGYSTGTLVIDTQDSDVYTDPDSITATVTGTSGGNFESLDITTNGTVTANINDTIDTTTVTLSGTTSLTEGEVANYRVSVDNTPLEDMTIDITYSYINAQSGDIVTNTNQVTIIAGTNSIDFDITTFDDNIAENAEIYDVTISNPSQGSFENIVIGNDTISTTIVDNDMTVLNDNVTQVEEADILDVGTNNLTTAEIATGNILSDDMLPMGSTLTNVTITGGTTDLGVAGEITVTTTEGNTLVVDTVTGDYTYTLANAVEHNVAGNDTVLDSFTYTVTDAKSIDFTANLDVTIVDDIPEVTAQDISLHIDPLTTNLSVVVDGSGSMSDSDLDLSMEAINALVAEYSALGAVNINIVQFFDGNATNTGWISSTNGVTLTSDGWTDIAVGLESVVDVSFGTQLPTNSGQNLVYFFGDGDANDDNITAFNDYLPTWSTFINSGIIDKLFTYSVNTTTVLNDIIKVADNAENLVSDDAVNITNVSTLASAVSQTVNVYSEGSLAETSTGDTIIDFGADGGHLSSITIGSSTVSYDSANITQTISGVNGDFEINFDTGAYTYTPTNYVNYTEQINASVVDNDGDILNTILLNIEISHDSSFIADAPTLDMSIDAGTLIPGSVVSDSDNFTNGSNEGWTGNNIDYSNNYMDIDGGYNTASKTFDFGLSHAGETVTITFTTNIRANRWDGGSDNFRVYNDGVEIFQDSMSSALTNESDLDSWVSHTFTTTLNASGQAVMQLYVDSNNSNEYVRIDNFSITGSVATPVYEYILDLDAGLTDLGETLSDIILTNVPTGVTLQDSSGNVITQNADSSYTVALDTNGDESVSIFSSTTLTTTQTDAISASITSSEASGDTATTTEDIAVDDFIYDGTVDIDAGAGFDTVTLDAGINLDFSDATMNSIANIEKIDMTGGDHTITNLTLSDVLDMTDPGNTLEIAGDASDALDVDTAGWTQTAVVDNGTNTTYEYSHDGSSDSITLTVDDQINTSGM